MSTDSTALHHLIPFSIRDAFSEPEQLLTAYFHESTVGLCILDKTFRYLAVNPALAHMNGVPATEHLGKTCREILGDIAKEIEPLFQRILETGEPVVGLAITGMLPTRSEPGHWIENYFPIKEADGTVKQIGVVVLEITQRRKLEESLRQLADGLQMEKDRLQVLREIDTTLASHPDLENLFPAIAACIGKVIPYDLAGTWLYDGKNQIMKAAALHSHVGEVFEVGEATPVAECMLAQVLLAATPATLNAEQVATLPFPSAKRLLKCGMKSVCGVPLITPKGPLGALGLSSRREQAFSPQDVELLGHAAISIALALENALSHQALQKEKQRLQALREVEAVLVTSLDLNELLPAISQCLRKVVPHENMGIHLYDETANVLRDCAPTNELKKKILPENGVLAVDQSIAGQVFRERKTRVLEQAELANVPYLVDQRAIEHGIRSLCFVPLITAKGSLGVLVLSSRAGHAFRREHIDILESAAAAIAQAVDNAQAHNALQRKRSRLQVLHAIDEALAASLDLHQVLPAVSECLQEALPHDHLAISVYDEGREALRDCAATSEVKKSISLNGLLPLETSLTGRAFIEGKPRVYHHAELLKVPFPITQRALAAGIRSSCFFPLAAAGGRMGVLSLSSHRDNAFQQDDLEWLEQVAAPLAQALQNAMAHKALKVEKRRLEVLLNVSALLTAGCKVQDVFLNISAYLRRILRHEFARLLLFDERNALLVEQALDFPMGKGLCAEIRVTDTNTPAGQALRRRTPLTFSKEEIQSFRVPISECLVAEGIRSLCCVPLVRPKAPLGVMVLGSTRENAFHVGDLVLLHQVAAQLAVALENQQASLEVEALKDRLTAERRYLQGESHSERYFEEIIGESPALRQTLRQVETVANSDATVLVLGETGTGKELVARAIHRASRRRDRRFIKLNCAAIPTGLLESELFGHEKGAFTGAVSRKIGHLELADQGTLFLDEVGEIPMELQPKLLRVLQDHEFERLGGTKTIKVDLRLIAATNRDLSQRVAENEFRSDLFYRLNVFPIRMPSLRQRREDIPLLVRHFVRKFARLHSRNIETIPTDTMNALINWDWPGNVRELENFIERSLILSEGAALLAPLGELQASGRRPGATPTSLEDAEREHILRVLRETGGVISGPNGAAHRLGLKRSTLQSKMDRLNIRRKDYSSQTHSKESL